MKQILLRKRNVLLLLIPLGIICTQWATSSAYIAEEIFATGIYKALSQGMGLITGCLPFSLMELIVAVGPWVVLGLLTRQIVLAVRVKEGPGEESVGCRRFVLLMTAVQNLLCLVAVIFFSYVILCGVNYHRYPVAVHFGLDVQDSSKEELEGLLVELADRATKLRAQLVTEDERGVYVLPYAERTLGKEAKKAYENLSREYAVFGGIYPAPKHVFFSRLMSWTEITGVFTPWTMEANVNIDISPYSIGSTMCHELAHLRGFMREDEANYISYRVCMASESLDLQYSGTMLALVYCGKNGFKPCKARDSNKNYISALTNGVQH